MPEFNNEFLYILIIIVIQTSRMISSDLESIISRNRAFIAKLFGI